MGIKGKKIKEIREVEKGINSNLFLISMTVTICTMVLMSINFFARGCFSPTKIGFFYLTVVLIYSLHKEFIRWLGEKKVKRNGEYFVYAWIILTTFLYIVDFFSNGYFDYSKEGYELSTLADIAYLTMEVLGVFVITRIFKIFFTTRK